MDLTPCGIRCAIVRRRYPIHQRKGQDMLDPQPLKGRTALVTGSGQISAKPS